MDSIRGFGPSRFLRGAKGCRGSRSMTSATGVSWATTCLPARRLGGTRCGFRNDPWGSLGSGILRRSRGFSVFFLWKQGVCEGRDSAWRH